MINIDAFPNFSQGPSVANLRSYPEERMPRPLFAASLHAVAQGGENIGIVSSIKQGFSNHSDWIGSLVRKFSPYRRQIRSYTLSYLANDASLMTSEEHAFARQRIFLEIRCF